MTAFSHVPRVASACKNSPYPKLSGTESVRPIGRGRARDDKGRICRHGRPVAPAGRASREMDGRAEDVGRGVSEAVCQPFTTNSAAPDTGGGKQEFRQRKEIPTPRGGGYWGCWGRDCFAWKRGVNARRRVSVPAFAKKPSMHRVPRNQLPSSALRTEEGRSTPSEHSFGPQRPRSSMGAGVFF
jgi:hypothetical protein